MYNEQNGEKTYNGQQNTIKQTNNCETRTQEGLSVKHEHKKSYL